MAGSGQFNSQPFPFHLLRITCLSVMELKNMFCRPLCSLLYIYVECGGGCAVRALTSVLRRQVRVRCSKASRHDDCLKYCGICCAECNCVPSGTAGNKDECPCYRDKTTGHGARKRPKCP
ncbi:hypothetical protein ZWY2020_017646 [Hordeum vulgare]|nr:hypothetical protein ZWY2020_017646 [Hordeum vulgare]